MWWAMAAQAGFSILGSASSNSTAGDQKDLTEYQNKMRLLSNASNQNSINTNQQFVIEESTQQAVNIQKNALRSKGAAEVAAAAAGVKGNSVAGAIMQIDRDAHNSDFNRRVNLARDFASLGQQRDAASFGTNTSMDLRTNSGESTGESFLGAAAASFGTYLQYQ